jgi:hypothetical protein
VEFWGTLVGKEVANGTGGRKIPPSVDNHSFGIPDFEPLLNSHQAAQLLDIPHKEPYKSRLGMERSTAPRGRWG